MDLHIYMDRESPISVVVDTSVTLPTAPTLLPHRWESCYSWSAESIWSYQYQVFIGKNQRGSSIWNWPRGTRDEVHSSWLVSLHSLLLATSERTTIIRTGVLWSYLSLRSWLWLDGHYIPWSLRSHPQSLLHLSQPSFLLMMISPSIPCRSSL